MRLAIIFITGFRFWFRLVLPIEYIINICIECLAGGVRKLRRKKTNCKIENAIVATHDLNTYQVFSLLKLN